MKTTKPPTTRTQPEQLSEQERAELIDRLDELDAQDDAPPMMDAEWAPPRSSSNQQGARSISDASAQMIFGKMEEARQAGPKAPRSEQAPKPRLGTPNSPSQRPTSTE